MKFAFQFQIDGGAYEQADWLNIMTSLFGFLGITFVGWIDESEELNYLWISIRDDTRAFDHLFTQTESIRFYIPEQNLSSKKEVARFLATQLSKYQMKAFVEDSIFVIQALRSDVERLCKFKLSL